MEETTATGLEGLVTALEGILDLDVFMTSFTTLIPVIGGVLIFAFIFRIVRKMIKGAQTGKARV